MSKSPDQIAPVVDDSPETRAALVRALCGEYGFDDVGIADARAPVPFADEIRQAMQDGRHGPLAWLKDSVDVRTDAQQFLVGAKSVVIVLVNYFHGHHADFLDDDALASRAKVSRYAWGSDYHNIMRRKLRKLRKRLVTAWPDAKISPFVDDKPITERAWAMKAGLGFIGKNTMFIHRERGTWTFIGGLVLDVELTPSLRTVDPDLCGSCTRCLDACPTGALTAPFTLDARRCLTTWNIEETTAPEAAHPDFQGHGWVAGCDICQEVCPWNRFAVVSTDARLGPRDGHVAFNVDDVPSDLEGTPLARPGVERLQLSASRALPRRPSTTTRIVRPRSKT